MSVNLDVRAAAAINHWRREIEVILAVIRHDCNPLGPDQQNDLLALGRGREILPSAQCPARTRPDTVRMTGQLG